MGQAEISSWSIDRLVCSDWKAQNDVADVYISNYAGDSVDFQVVRTPDGDIVPFNATSDFVSNSWYLHTSESDAVDSVILEVDKRLNDWSSEIERIIPMLAPLKWKVGRGSAVPESIWALLAYLYELRASMNENKIIEALALDLKCEVSTTKERVKNLRRIGFLTAPGQGARGEGKATKEARKILEKEGLLNAKKGK
jgi:hypothetical protein